MSQLLRNIPQFFAPETPAPSPSAGSNSLGKSMGTEDIIDFLAGDDDNPEVIDLTPERDKTPPTGKEASSKETQTQEKDENEETTEDDELEEIERELQGPTEDQLELVTPVRRKEILTKYPTLFKDFPYLEKAYYRDQQFTEIHGTIEDAKIAVEKANTLDKFESEIMAGTTETILKAVKEENPEGFLKLVDNYLPTLAKVDERAYMHILGNITKHTIVAMVKEAKQSGNTALQSAAALLNQFVFGSTNYTPPTNLSRENPQEKETENKITQREQEFMQRQLETINSDVNTRVNNVLKNTIEQHIDPRNTMSDYVKRNAVKDAMESLGELLSKDSRFTALTDKLWEAAVKENFSKASVDRIRSAFVSKSRTLLPSVIKKARNEALRGTGHRVKSDENEETTSNRSPISSAGKPRSSTPGKIKSAKEIPAGMSTLEFLNSD